ncbi:hypothetical protein H8S95_11355 [Pontibacter sp. KCTC 32443]|uniref:hypothetical protein n=1 Tax=Pontibacter sp. KCTC 32443 TaxID=2764721 RepID=UPI00164E9A72|nr:hypothetical protein [Pontibacter sp. KCTC 32443]MBC5774660.1 hypothetical protein [Pontibacter sp. KCTC 32443]
MKASAAFVHHTYGRLYMELKNIVAVYTFNSDYQQFILPSYAAQSIVNVRKKRLSNT